MMKKYYYFSVLITLTACQPTATEVESGEGINLVIDAFEQQLENDVFDDGITSNLD